MEVTGWPSMASRDEEDISSSQGKSGEVVSSAARRRTPSQQTNRGHTLLITATSQAETLMHLGQRRPAGHETTVRRRWKEKGVELQTSGEVRVVGDWSSRSMTLKLQPSGSSRHSRM